jgi:ABC-2 type transport system ATP-binding protein
VNKHPKPPKASDKLHVPSGPPAALELHAVEKNYGDATALETLSLRVESGQRVALLGHNGSGKTTMLRMSSGLLSTSSGDITIFDQPAGSLAARARLSYIADQPTFYDDLSLWQHLEYVARLHGVDKWDQYAADLLDHLGLYERADDLPKSFSRGLKQKAAIAIAFVRPFELLIVDEPFVGLDAAGKDALLELFDQAHDDGAALVVATHELGFVHST